MNAPIEQEQQPATEPLTAWDCYNTMDESLSKAEGIIFVMQQMNPGMESPEKIGWALWAVSDFLFDARKAMEAAHECSKGGAVAPK